MKKKHHKILIPIALVLIFFIVLLSTIRNFSLASDINISSKIYKIENNTITNISPRTNIELYEKYFDLENCYIKVTNELNIELTSGYVYTGSKTIVYNNTNEIIETYTNIITGDITKDGLVDIDDITTLSEYLITNNNLSEIELNAIDINNDNEVKINDLTLLEDTINSEYNNLLLDKESITLMTNETERLIPTIEPNIILNQNLIWSSSNESIATIDESGKIFPHRVGETTITATTKDGNLSKTATITIDNTPILDSTAETLYTGGDNKEISIKAVDYDNLRCESDNENIVTCEIQNKRLILSPINDGVTKVKVISPTYGYAEINIETLYTYFTIFPKAWCLTPRSSASGGIISGFNFGDLSVKSISDRNIIINAIISRNSFGVEAWNNTGDAQVVFTESNGHNNATFTAHVYRLNLSQKSGTTTIGNNIEVDITSANTGDLSCTSSDNETATCTIENNNLTITPIKVGNATITVNGSQCGSENYTLTIVEEGDTP